jgi:hypothetical protein
VPKSQELAVTHPTDREIVRKMSDVIAKSPLDIKRGEAVFLDRHGAAFGRQKYERLVRWYKLGIYGAMIGGAALFISGGWLAGGALYLAGAAPVWLASYRGSAKLMAIDVLARQGHLEEAQRRLDAVPSLRRRSPVYYGLIAGNLASHRGDYAAALTFWREAFPRAQGITREWLNLSIAKALLLSGKLEEARRTFDAVTFPPAADDTLTGMTLTRVMFALHDPKATPSVDELHDWARNALAYSHTGVELAALGWAFERAGEHDMAQLLASEAPERMHYPYLATWWPALQQWLDGRTAKPDPDPT